MWSSLFKVFSGHILEVFLWGGQDWIWEEIGTRLDILYHPFLPVIKGVFNNRAPGGTRFGISLSFSLLYSKLCSFNFLSRLFLLLTCFARARRAALLHQEAWLPTYTITLPSLAEFAFVNFVFLFRFVVLLKTFYSRYRFLLLRDTCNSMGTC